MSPFLRDDPPDLRRQIGYLRKLCLNVSRPSPHHIKVGKVNWYPATGAIVVDGLGRHPRKGFSAVLDLVNPGGRRRTARPVSSRTSPANDNFRLKAAETSFSFLDVFPSDGEDINDDKTNWDPDHADERQ